MPKLDLPDLELSEPLEDSDEKFNSPITRVADIGGAAVAVESAAGGEFAAWNGWWRRRCRRRHFWVWIWIG
jgi:hypothetical protein